MRQASHVVLIASIISMIVSTASASETMWVKKTTDTDWTWFEDYYYPWASYIVACEPERTCQVGMGIYSFGAPRGEKIRFNGQTEILVIGVGSIHIRPADGQGPVKAAIAQKKAGLATITWDF
ncbi:MULTISPECIES: hypothetical protein [Klebsiella]|uniref:hypothetical protein n=1 Tax=Klebsiella TaxID=570 RepID=UPI0011E48F21|nr:MULTISPECIES: hypothetical protein [Klebsiella]MBZ7507708.1 hypothetical protein [Klebsiella michiganensis]MDD9664766.1 hypothetical protein [Klebsiella pasteurii]MDD9670493.1 hypothetical protein [Klebsiella pasteurii]MDD9686345.1 hypothetical protein [Klebsiella pasteurii]TYE57418.1 hypothetical protein DJ508_15700 [Klebsiella michiganensis]